MKWLRAGLFTLISLLVLSGTHARALETSPFEPTPKLSESPVLIAAYSLSGSVPGYVELFNSSPQPVSLVGWKLEFIAADSTVLLANLDGWIASSNYVMAADVSVISNADFQYEFSGNASTPKSVRLVPRDTFASHEVAVSKDGQYQRKVSTSTGNYLSTFEAVTIPELYSGGFYDFPQSTDLRFSEILANPRACSPLEEMLDCMDYVKIYNASTSPVDLASFRLRIGYKGQAASSSNTYELNGIVKPGHFTTITSDSSGEAISVTNSGGFVWLEDKYGLIRYDSTIQSYDDASASSKKGQAWAYDESDGVWKWTSRPTPEDASSIFPPPIVKPPTVRTKTYAPCRSGQYRSADTNRCRTLANSTVASLKPCLANQYRSAETNRCRNLATASASTFKPCAAGQERNPTTNRCRKTASEIPASAFSVDPMTDTGKAFAGWWALGGVGMLAAGYGIWEWRHEALGGIRRIGTFFTSGK